MTPALRLVRDVFGVGVLAAGFILCLAYFGLLLALVLWIVLGVIAVAGAR